MTLAEVETVLLALDGVRGSTVRGQRTWTVSGRLVARAEDASTLVVRVELGARERYVAAYPATFAVTPRMERHQKMQVVLDHGNDDQVRRALHGAWEMQRSD
ncbi:MAG: MmcQ/YjbR family DNA-binding protein [Nocardioides sp.]